MYVSQSFSVSPLAQVLKLAIWAPVLLISPCALALTVENGSTKNIDASTALDSWLVRGASRLNANGATTREIRAQTGSTLVLNGTSVTGSGSNSGVELSNSTANIANSKLTSERAGLRLISTINGGSSASVSNSEIVGSQFGVNMSAESRLTLES
ncbi:hypothetical protein [Pseudomonas sp. GM55]|uniref:hypothetical protein n=1 Tax=Pseudomonas sp. GM55 TaxID=1144333 RepID=UPI00027067D0|nr:hypothetical protein PMI31_04610 [Pseudomonas sp. GM55]